MGTGVITQRCAKPPTVKAAKSGPRAGLFKSARMFCDAAPIPSESHVPAPLGERLQHPEGRCIKRVKPNEVAMESRRSICPQNS